MKNETFEKVTTYIENNSEYTIIYYAEGWNIGEDILHYAGINNKYINEEGKLTKQLNGLEMNISRSVKECISSIHYKEGINYIMENEGVDVLEACKRFLAREAA